MSHLLISAAHKSSGKTTISIGLCAALQQQLQAQGKRIQAFKKGPDYIDPMWLGMATKGDCHNLDYNTMGKPEIIRSFQHYSQNADISLIEGNKGLYDGLDLDGGNSNAALAVLLKAPVVLVIDAQGMTRGIAPLILGYQAFESELHIAGVILNKLGGNRHESKLRAVIEHYTDVPVIGAVHRDPKLQIEERHLGLIPSNEESAASQYIENVAGIVKQQVDIHLISEIAHAASEPSPVEEIVATSKQNIGKGLRIGIVKDKAFGFYYPGDLYAFKDAAAELISIDTLNDKQLPDIDALFIGGGFPETQMQALAENETLRESIKQALQNGLPTYAECGGLMYLTRSITWKEKHYPMVGVIPADTVMHKRPQGRGYVKMQETTDHLWPSEGTTDSLICAHEFHYSSIENIDGDFKYAYKVKRGHGVDGQHDGIIYGNILGCYTHLRHVENNPWVHRFLKFVGNTRDALNASKTKQGTNT